MEHKSHRLRSQCHRKMSHIAALAPLEHIVELELNNHRERSLVGRSLAEHSLVWRSPAELAERSLADNHWAAAGSAAGLAAGPSSPRWSSAWLQAPSLSSRPQASGRPERHKASTLKSIKIRFFHYFVDSPFVLLNPFYFSSFLFIPLGLRRRSRRW